MKSNLIFNHRGCTFTDKTLRIVLKCMLANDNLDDDAEYYALSFIKNKIVLKTYDDLDFHEFILKGSFRISNLICNISNIFGINSAKEYAKCLSTLLKKDVDIETLDFFTAIDTRDALRVGFAVFTTDEDRNELKSLLALIHLFECANEDYEQTIINANDFADLIFINGIGIRAIDQGNNLLLRPIDKAFDSPQENYINYSGILVPPCINYIVSCSVVDEFDKATSTSQDMIPNFIHKFEQLCGHKLNLPKKKYDFSNWGHESKFFGKWYNIHKGDNPVMSLYTISIYDFDATGSAKLSRVFVSDINYPNHENWLPRKFSWISNDGTLVLNPNTDQEASYELFIIDNKPVLKGKYGVYYKTLQDAKDAIR